MAENLIKVPVKGILKNSTSFEGTSSAASKWYEEFSYYFIILENSIFLFISILNIIF